MTTRDDLIKAALDAADLFRGADDPISSEFEELVRAADAYGSSDEHSYDKHSYNSYDGCLVCGCLVCTVRQMTEGAPEKAWPTQTTQPGDEITGIVLRMGGTAHNAFVDLWTWGEERVRITCFVLSLRHEMEAAEVQIGDTVTARFDEMREVEHPRFGEFKQRVFTVAVTRGHH